ncbi:MAG: HU family DNA-binding protein [Phycisphaerales bacterium]|jgi:nucleoid DNA-binding protein
MAKKAAKSAKASKPAAKPAKITGASKIRTKGEIFNVIAEHNSLSRKQVAGVFDTMSAIIGADLAKGSGTFKVPNLMKITVVAKPAQPARKGINPFTGEETTFKAKPARKVVKIRPLAALKGMV